MSVWDWYVRRGRLSRGAFWLQYVLPGILLPILAAWVDRALGLPATTLVTETGVAVDDPEGPLRSAVAYLLAVPMISAFVARLHDNGYSAWRLLFAFIPVVGALVLIALACFFTGDRVPNRYGPPPAPWRRPRLPAALRRPRVPA